LASPSAFAFHPHSYMGCQWRSGFKDPDTRESHPYTGIDYGRVSRRDCVALIPYISIWRDLTPENTNFIPTPGYSGSVEAFSLHDIAHVLTVNTLEGGCSCGMASDAQMICTLVDGRLVALHLIDHECSAGSGGELFTAQFAGSLLALVTFGLNSRQRQKLGLRIDSNGPLYENDPFSSFAVVEYPAVDDHRCLASGIWDQPCQDLGNGRHVHYQRNHKTYADPDRAAGRSRRGASPRSYGNPWRHICAGLDPELRYAITVAGAERDADAQEMKAK